VTDAWDANTFPVRKYNSRTFHLKFVDHVFFRFFRRFPRINVGGDSTHFPFLEDAPASHASPSRRRVGCDNNEIYLNVVGGPNYKGNVYRLGTLRKRFSCSKSAPSTSIAPVEDQIEEMHETINKLYAELLEKANKEKTLEEKMLQMMKNHDHQSQEMRQQMQEQNEQIPQQNKQMQRILQHLHIQSIMLTPSLSPTIADGTEHHINDAQIDHPHDMGNDH